MYEYILKTSVRVVLISGEAAIVKRTYIVSDVQLFAFDFQVQVCNSFSLTLLV